jgi:hypothetical protein
MWDIVTGPWPWYVAGPLLSLVFFLALYFGKTFGVSSTLRTLCAAGGAGRYAEFFKIRWKDQSWNIVFVLGALVGGAIASSFLTATSAVEISESTQKALLSLGVDPPTQYLPQSIFSWEKLPNISNLLLIVGGGFLVGFGTRYAGGCTSGHAITGLSSLQLPSLIATVGFFIGGLLMTHLFLPFILTL